MKRDLFTLYHYFSRNEEGLVTNIEKLSRLAALGYKSAAIADRRDVDNS
jgi:hypothetical protein